MKHTKLLWVILFAVCALLAGISSASEASDGRRYYSSGVEANPLFEGEGAEYAPVSYSSDAAYSEDIDYRDTMEETSADLRAGMVRRQNVIAVGLRTETEYDWIVMAKEIFALAVAHTGQPREGDTLTWHWRDRTIDISVDVMDGLQYVTIAYTINYYTTAAMEEELDREVAALLSTLDLWDEDAYGRILGIYEYICRNVAYDRANASNTSYTLKYTPYAALIQKKAVCQGIALLYYRLACELDLDTRIIFGRGRNENHTWMIVRLGESYFYLDPTWDLGKTSYGYFLKGEGNFPDHKRMDNPLCGLYYTSPAFYGAYPVAKQSFVPSDIPEDGIGGMCGDGAAWRLGVDGRLVITGWGTVADCRDSEAPWAAYAPFVREIIIDKGIRSVGAYSFYGCTEVETVVLPDSSVIVGENAFFDGTEVVFAGTASLSAAAEASDGTRYLIAEDLPAGIVSLGDRLALEGAERIQFVSSDGSKRLTGLDAVEVGVRIQLLDGNGGVADEVTVALWGDFDMDGDVDEVDSVVLLWSFLKPQTYCSVPHYDLNGDGLVNASDAAFGEQ